MTGSTHYIVRHGFSECDVWRKAMGQTAPLLAVADSGYCLDAPDNMPAGAMRACGSTQHIAGQTTTRGIDW